MEITFVVWNFWSRTLSASGSYSQAGWLAGWQTKSIFLNSLQIEMLESSLRLTKVQHYYSSTNAFKLVYAKA